MILSVKFTSYKAEVLAKIQQAKNNALEICGGTAEKYAKENITKNRSVQTGVLRNSIAHEQRDENTEAVGTNVEYAPYVEFGHNQEPGRYVPAIGARLVADHVAAKPYLRPAVENHRSEYEKIIRGELQKV